MRTAALLLLAGWAANAQDAIPAAYFESPLVRLGQYVLWHDPGAVERLDFRYGIGGPALAPKPPFQFTEEDMDGSNPKIKVKDAGGRKWTVKFGKEARPETFCTRLAWAMGYYVDPDYLVEDGEIAGVKGLTRARKEVDASGRFHDGRFELRSKDLKSLKTVDWSWTENPFVGTPELNGLKILHMLLSNWDDKDARDDSRGSNTAIFQVGDRYVYFVSDWGGALGSWGKYFTRSKWNAEAFRRQSADFVRVENGGLRWGYTGQHTALMTQGITFGDIAWLLKYLGRVTDEQLRAGLAASGASEEETRVYIEGLRMRIQQLQKLAG